MFLHEDSWQNCIVNVSDGCQTHLIWISHYVQVCFKTWRTWIATTTSACSTSSKHSATHFRIDRSSPKWKKTMVFFGSSRIVLIDGRLVYPAQKDVLTYFIKSRTRQDFYHSTFWRRSFWLSNSIINTLSLEFKLWIQQGWHVAHSFHCCEAKRKKFAFWFQWGAGELELHWPVGASRYTPPEVFTVECNRRGIREL